MLPWASEMFEIITKGICWLSTWKLNSKNSLENRSNISYLDLALRIVISFPISSKKTNKFLESRLTSTIVIYFQSKLNLHSKFMKIKLSLNLLSNHWWSEEILNFWCQHDCGWFATEILNLLWIEIQINIERNTCSLSNLFISCLLPPSV